MRTIKFRGKHYIHYHNYATEKHDIVRDVWVYGYYLVNQFGEHTICNDDGAWKVDPETVGQFTGVLDKNGKEVYEGDFLQYHPGGDKRRKAVELVEYVFDESFYGHTGYSVRKNTHDIVIGNLTDNPELITPEKTCA